MDPHSLIFNFFHIRHNFFKSIHSTFIHFFKCNLEEKNIYVAKKIPSTRNEIRYAENTHKYFPIYKIGVRVVWGWIFYMIPKKRECDKWEKEGWWGRKLVYDWISDIACLFWSDQNRNKNQNFWNLLFFVKNVLFWFIFRFGIQN